MFIKGIETRYPKEALLNRLTIEGNVISCIYKDALLLDESNLSSSDFITEDGRFYYNLAKMLRKLKFNAFDEVTILSNINEDIKTQFTDRGEYETIQNMIDVINISNWETYADNLHRENIILKLYDDGFNVTKKIIDSQGKEIIPLKLFRKMDSESIIDWYENRLAQTSIGYTSKVLEDEILDIDDDFIKSLDEGLEQGVPFDFAGEDINGDDMRCFPFLSNQVGGFVDGTFNVLGGYSSTGKTTMWITIIVALLYRERKVLIISNEQKVKVFKIGVLIWILYKHFRVTSITKGRITKGNFSDEEKEAINKAREYFKEHYSGKIRFVGIPDADMNTTRKKIRQYVLQDGYDTVLYDTLKIEFDSLQDNNVWLSLIKDSREFDKIAKKYNIIMLASLQLAINTMGKLFLDASVLSMSKQIKEVLEVLLLMRNVYREELDKDNKKFFCYPFQKKKIGDEWKEVPYEIDENAVYKMLFVDKGRNGINSSDSGIAYLLKFNGALGTFAEVAQCRPKHGTIQ